MHYSNSYYLPEKWPAYTVKLTRDGQLKELFDAGLRPGYTSMAKNTELDLKHARMNFVLTNGKSLPEFDAEQGRVTLTRVGLLRLRFISQPLSVEEAKKTMMRWLPFFSEKRHKTEAQLDDFLGQASADYSGYDDRDFGAAPVGFSGGWKDTNEVGYGVRFEKSWNELLPVRIYFNVVWHYVRYEKEEGDFYDEPIPSPVGYKIETVKSWGPDDISEMMYAKGISFLPGRGLSQDDQKDVVEKSEKKSEEDYLQGKQNIVKSNKKISPDIDKLPHQFDENSWPRITVGLLLSVILIFSVRTRINKK